MRPGRVFFPVALLLLAGGLLVVAQGEEGAGAGAGAGAGDEVGAGRFLSFPQPGQKRGVVFPGCPQKLQVQRLSGGGCGFAGGPRAGVGPGVRTDGGPGGFRSLRLAGETIGRFDWPEEGGFELGGTKLAKDDLDLGAGGLGLAGIGGSLPALEFSSSFWGDAG